MQSISLVDSSRKWGVFFAFGVDFYLLKKMRILIKKTGQTAEIQFAFCIILLEGDLIYAHILQQAMKKIILYSGFRALGRHENESKREYLTSI